MSPRGRRRLPRPWPWGKLRASRSCFKGEAVALSSLCSRQRRACDPRPADRPFRAPPPPDAALRAVAMETAAARPALVVSFLWRAARRPETAAAPAQASTPETPS